jgi:hypothetical protein
MTMRVLRIGDPNREPVQGFSGFWERPTTRLGFFQPYAPLSSIVLWDDYHTFQWEFGPSGSVYYGTGANGGTGRIGTWRRPGPALLDGTIFPGLAGVFRIRLTLTISMDTEIVETPYVRTGDTYRIVAHKGAVNEFDDLDMIPFYSGERLYDYFETLPSFAERDHTDAINTSSNPCYVLTFTGDFTFAADEAVLFALLWRGDEPTVDNRRFMFFDTNSYIEIDRVG